MTGDVGRGVHGSTEEAARVTLHDEELVVDAEPVESGRIRATKRVDTSTHEELVELASERADAERAPALENDSGEIETLPDGSVSIPVFEERLVVKKELYVRERMIIRKFREITQEQVSATLRSERLEVEADDGVVLRDDGLDGAVGD